MRSPIPDRVSDTKSVEHRLLMRRGKRQKAKGKRQKARGKRQKAKGKRQEAKGGINNQFLITGFSMIFE
jgi:uncharacterized protein YjbJ (UPF0337 family)